MSPSQGEDREFESRCPLILQETSNMVLLFIITLFIIFSYIYKTPNKNSPINIVKSSTPNSYLNKNKNSQNNLPAQNLISTTLNNIIKPRKIKTPQIVEPKDIIGENIIYSNNSYQNITTICWEKTTNYPKSYNLKLIDHYLHKITINTLAHKEINCLNVSDFAIFEKQNSNIIKIENLENKNNIVKKSDSTMYLSILQEHSFIDGFYNNSSFSIIKDDCIQYRINWTANIKKHKNLCTVTIEKFGYKKIQLTNIVEFYIYELTNNNKIIKLFNNGSFCNQLTLPTSKIYIVLKQQSSSNTVNLYFYKENILLHYVPYADSTFKLSNKLQPNGSITCKVYNTKNCLYNDTSTIKLEDNGNVTYLSNSYIEAFKIINNFTFLDKEDCINIYYYKKECLNFYLVDEFTKNADFKEIVPNKFEDDISSINYHVKYKKNRYADIIFLYFTMDNRHYPVLKAFDNGLYGNTYKNSFFSGSAIYNIPLADFYKGLEGKYKDVNTISQSFLTKEQKANFKEYVNKIYGNYKLDINYEELPKQFLDNLVLEDAMLDELSDYITYLHDQGFVNINYRTKQIFDNSNNLILDYKLKKDQLTSEIIKTGKYNKKWKSEIELYQISLKTYPDSIYQYHSKFLGQQSFDIYIPSKKIAIEYQGIQHYEPVDIFGGTEGFSKRIKLDNQKRTICKKNNIKLIEWKYDLPINKVNFDKLIQ